MNILILLFENVVDVLISVYLFNLCVLAVTVLLNLAHSLFIGDLKNIVLISF